MAVMAPHEYAKQNTLTATRGHTSTSNSVWNVFLKCGKTRRHEKAFTWCFDALMLWCFVFRMRIRELGSFSHNTMKQNIINSALSSGNLLENLISFPMFSVCFRRFRCKSNGRNIWRERFTPNRYTFKLWRIGWTVEWPRKLNQKWCENTHNIIHPLSH